ncbi:beta-lactamase family protein [Kribbella qitaiheensis]|uniref:Beta-lactamase family protein n=1 Tax=Kribbella qitaiheensis TaxID=1544730 RepID=A0A7G6WX90_9ACTN|nr:serine hydrolase domain-containing protein [Kribbella qitaiheensis]QNE18605.1 beta-lactamase family protein [Kribbella qitaiheensis]
MVGLQERVQQVLEELVEAGERGLQVAVYLNGELIVDAVAGLADSATGRPMAPDTPVFSFSTGKGMAATIAHLLVKDGVLGYDTPVVDVWPEYGEAGKESTTVRHVLTHTTGLPAMPAETGPGVLSDWPRICAGLAAAEPLWEPGTRTGYHSYTFGYLIGEIARRVTGTPMRRLLHDRVATPLGMRGELFFGVPEADLTRIARLEDTQPEPTSALDSDSVLAGWERQPTAAMGNDSTLLRADIPSVGTFTARGIAAMYSALIDGRLVDEEQLRELSATAFEGTDQVFGNPARLALGYPLGRLSAEPFESSAAFGWPGGGGSYAYADPTSGVAFGLTKTRLAPTFTTAQRLADLVTAEVTG